MNWEDYWTSYPKQFGKTEFSRQVRYTVGGQPLPDSKIIETVEAVCARLELGPDDVLLDLCSGNGLITRHLAQRCSRVVGVDFSPTLIEVATASHSAENISYLRGSVPEVLYRPEFSGQKFTKILMNGGLQYFRPRDLPVLIFGMCNVLAEAGVILLTAIPDRSRKSAFYNTPGRKLRHVRDRILSRDQMGTWWDTEMVERVCRDHDLDCRFLPTAGMVGTPYRIDARISWQNPAGRESIEGKRLSPT